MKRMLKRTLAAVLALTVITGGLPGAFGGADLLKTAITASAATDPGSSYDTEVYDYTEGFGCYTNYAVDECMKGYNVVAAPGAVIMNGQYLCSVFNPSYSFSAYLEYTGKTEKELDIPLSFYNGDGTVHTIQHADVLSLTFALNHIYVDFEYEEYLSDSGCWTLTLARHPDYGYMTDWLTIKAPEGRELEVPAGLRFASGDGTENNPYHLELIYSDDPLPACETVSVGKKWHAGDLVNTNAYFTTGADDVFQMLRKELPPALLGENEDYKPVTVFKTIRHDHRNVLFDNHVKAGGIEIVGGSGTQNDPFQLAPFVDEDAKILTLNAIELTMEGKIPTFPTKYKHQYVISGNSFRFSEFGGTFEHDYSFSNGWRCEQIPGLRFYDGDTFPPKGYESLMDGDNLTFDFNTRPVLRFPATISFNANGGTGEMVSVANEGEVVYTLPECRFTAPENMEFEGWEFNGFILQPGQKIPVEDTEVSVKAIWRDIVSPTITTQPQNASGKVGDTAVFTVGATGGNLSYQWQYLRSGAWIDSTIEGAKTAQLRVPITAESDGQQYRCVVSNSAGSINSNVVSISVEHIAPSAVFNPTTGVLTLSGNVTADEVRELFREYGDAVTSIVASEGTILPANCSNLFADFSKVTTIDLSKADTGSVTDMSGMFSGCSALKTIYVSDLWSLNSITSDINMFRGCTSLVGGNGTVFDPAYTSSIRAQIDGKGGKPGYFTEKGFAVLTKKECQAVTDSAAPAVSVGFSAEILQGWDLLEYGILYYNSGNVIHTEHLTLDNVGVCGIQKIHGWNAEIADLGYGVTAVGFVTAKNTAGTVRTMYTGELGGKYAELKPVTLTRLDNKVVTSNGKNKISVGFKADIPEGSTVEEYGLLYYNSGNVIHTEHLILENDGVCGIKKANYWSANITDNGYGVVCVGFVTVKDKKGNVTTYYTEELGNGVNAMAEVAKNVKLTKRANKAVSANGKNKVYAGFDASLPTGYTVEDYGLLYYNSGNVIHTEHLTLDNVGICGIQKAKYWGANITDNGYGVVCVGFVKVKSPNGYITTLYTEELGNSFTAVSEAAAANAVTLTKQANKAVTSGGKNKVYCGFTANTAAGYTVEDYGLIYYNSGNVIHTEHLTLENIGVCGIQNAKFWGANITDNGYGVVCVGFVKVKDANGYVTTLYTGELGAKYTDLVG